MNVKRIFGFLLILFGLFFGYVFYLAGEAEQTATGETVVQSGRIITVENYDELVRTAVEIGSSPDPGPVVIYLGSLHPFRVRIGDQLISGEERENSFGVPNSYYQWWTLNSPTIVVEVGLDLHIAVQNNRPDGEGVMTIVQDPDSYRTVQLLGYLCALALAVIGIGIQFITFD